MRNIIFIWLLLMNTSSTAQSNLSYIDSIKLSLHPINDTDKVETMISLSGFFSTISYDSAVMYGNKALNLAEQINFQQGRVAALCILGIANTRGGNLSKALEYEFKGFQIAKVNKFKEGEALSLYCIGKSYYFLKDYINSIKYCSLARNLHLENQEFRRDLINVYYAKNDPFFDNDLVLGEAFMEDNQLDSALVYFRKLYNESTHQSWKGIISIFLGDALFRKGEKDSGIYYLKYAFFQKQDEKDYYSLSWASSILARCYKEMNQPDSSIYYAKIGLQSAQQVGFKDRMLKSARHLAEEYEKINTKEAYSYLKLATSLNDELFGQEKVFELQKTLSEAQQHQQELQNKQIEYNNKVKFYLLLSGLGIILGIALILFYNNKKVKKAKNIIENTLKKLKSTQSQLIQSEKMASLGELTAGIAHEIQNPLNFVNNFSELSVDLAKELKEEVEKLEIPEKDKEYVSEIIGDLSQNQEKINHHGKRASSIVKGMLEHSRKSSGTKELTDLNTLADEYLRLAYHGLKAKDKDFNASMETYFDPNLPKIEVIPQDIGRVLLNLINNAFYAVNERDKKGETGYQPSVSITTQLTANTQLLIAIKDNGSGIPDTIKDKIFQPFFTTKPTGQGTGLGLSLTYDIVKAHGGELSVESKEGEGTTFLILLKVEL